MQGICVGGRFWSPRPRERERWYALWLLAQGWTSSATAEALERDPHTIGRWAAAFGEGGPPFSIFEQSGAPPALSVKEPPARSGIELANWNWKVVHQFVSGRFGISLSRSSCLNYPRLHEGRLCTAWDLF